MHKTAATPLTFLYAALVVYASLYPFADWRDQGIAPWAFLFAPPPRYWTGLDVAVNMAGYMPLGGLLVLGALRRGHARFALLISCALACVLSLGMEMAQGFLTARVPSREDWLLNTAGALTGAAATLLLERWGAIERWSALRRHWFVADARGGLVLLATWPAALLFPPAVPFGLGQVVQRLEAQAWDWLDGTPVAQWLPLEAAGLQPLSPAAELLCVILGLLIPVPAGVRRDSIFGPATNVRARGAGCWCVYRQLVGCHELGPGACRGLDGCTHPARYGACVGAGLGARTGASACMHCAGAVGLGHLPEPFESSTGEPVPVANLAGMGTRNASFGFTDWRSGWAGCGPTRRCCTPWRWSGAKTGKTRIGP